MHTGLLSGWSANGPDFRAFLSATFASAVGTEITLLALPLFALLTLDAGTGAIGLLTAAQFVPWLVLALPAGVLVDRTAHRPLLVACDLGRAVLIGLVPLAAWTGTLSVPVLLAVVLAAGCLTVVFDIAAGAYVPRLVEPAQLGSANGSLTTATAVAYVAGPPLGGALVGAVGAPRAVVLDAVSFLVSAAFLARIRTRHADVPAETPAARREGGTGWSRLMAGVAVLRRDPALGRLTTFTAAFNLASNAVIVVLLVFLVRDAGLSPEALGLVYGLSAIGAIAGGALSARISRRLGIGRAIAVEIVVVTVGEIALAATPASAAAGPWVVVVTGVMFFAFTAFQAQAVTVRQTRTPQHVLGRMLAAHRLAVFGAIPLGATFGGFLADAIGRRETLVLAAAWITVAAVLPLTAPIRTLREPLEPLDAPATQAG
jgi:MFS family permease